MASISDDGGGLKRILIVCSDGKRRPIRLGKMTMKQAGAFKLHVERLVVAPYSELPTDTAKWLADLDDKMHARLAGVGLAKPRRFSTMTLGPFIDAYIADRTDAKPRTIIN